jgi:hypothetical protein
MRVAIPAALAAATLAVPLAGCGGSAEASADRAKIQREADLYAIEQLEVKWHRAASTQNVDLVMSLFAPDATLTLGTETLKGKAQIRDFFVHKSAPYQPGNHWVSETPAYKIKTTVDGEKGTLRFECHYVDPKTGKVALISGGDNAVQKIGGRWLITNVAPLTATLTP